MKKLNEKWSGGTLLKVLSLKEDEGLQIEYIDVSGNERIKLIKCLCDVKK